MFRPTWSSSGVRNYGWGNCCLLYLSLSLMLRPTVSRPVCPGIKHPTGVYGHILISVRQLRVCWSGALSLTRVWVCRLQLLLALASAVILGSESRGAYDHIFTTVRQLRVCWCGALSLTRVWVCRLQLLLALASAVILGSESRGACDHILLSQILDFPFRRLLRLAESRWRYSTPLPHVRLLYRCLGC
jgi:hypothetical protein